MTDAEINVNDTVWIKLTDDGRAYHRRWYDALPHPMPPYRGIEEDAQGWSKWQLWRLMHEFGGALYNGCKPPFESNIRLYAPTGEGVHFENCVAYTNRDGPGYNPAGRSPPTDARARIIAALEAENDEIGLVVQMPDGVKIEPEELWICGAGCWCRTDGSYASFDGGRGGVTFEPEDATAIAAACGAWKARQS